MCLCCGNLIKITVNSDQRHISKCYGFTVLFLIIGAFAIFVRYVCCHRQKFIVTVPMPMKGRSIQYFCPFSMLDFFFSSSSFSSVSLLSFLHIQLANLNPHLTQCAPFASSLPLHTHTHTLAHLFYPSVLHLNANQIHIRFLWIAHGSTFNIQKLQIIVFYV